MSSTCREKKVQVVCQGTGFVRCGFSLVAAARMTLAFAQSADSVGTSRFAGIRFATGKIGFL
jgi:hypothetical protein